VLEGDAGKMNFCGEWLAENTPPNVSVVPRVDVYRVGVLTVRAIKMFHNKFSLTAAVTATAITTFSLISSSFAYDNGLAATRKETPCPYIFFLLILISIHIAPMGWSSWCTNGIFLFLFSF
jgi:hypothetical protein